MSKSAIPAERLGTQCKNPLGLGQTDSTSSNIGEYNFAIRMFDDNQTLFNTIQHNS